MSEHSEDTLSPLTFERIGAALVLCTTEGRLRQLTPEARRLFERFGLATAEGSTIQASLWSLLAEHRLGDQVEWQPNNQPELLGISRYPAGDAHYLLMMREVSDQRQEIARRLHRQRLECVGRLIASVSHDLRTVASSIVYNAEVLSSNDRDLNAGEFAATVREISVASQHLSTSVDGLLGYARLGPQISVPVALDGCIARSVALVRRMFREREDALQVQVQPGASHVVGNSILVDQILVNLLANAAESAEQPLSIRISTERLGSDVEVRIADNGPGVPENVRSNLFRPFFSTKTDGSGVGLAVAREAARELGGDLKWVPSKVGACFALVLPAHTTSSAADKPLSTVQRLSNSASRHRNP